MSLFPPLVPGCTTVPWGSWIFVSSVMTSHLEWWKCIISDFAMSNATALSCTYWKAVLAATSSALEFPSLVLPWATNATLSM
jgi:hypothetical protein